LTSTEAAHPEPLNDKCQELDDLLVRNKKALAHKLLIKKQLEHLHKRLHLKIKNTQAKMDDFLYIQDNWMIRFSKAKAL
jgi:hypothetical protein